MGLFGCIGWMIISEMARRRKKREELEDAMTEYFRNKIEKDKEMS